VLASYVYKTYSADLKNIYEVVEIPNRSKTQYAILGALSLEPMSGYEMKKRMAMNTDHFWSESNGQLYPTLAKLAEKKFITVKEEVVGGKWRKIYTITKNGKQKLSQWLLEDVEYYPARDALLLKLFYGQNVSPSVSIRHIEKHAEKCKKALSIYKDIESRLEQMVKAGKRPVYPLLTVKAGVNTVCTELAWCKESIQLIKKYG